MLTSFNLGLSEGLAINSNNSENSDSDKMKIIIVSNPVDITEEHDILHALFEAGLDHFHLRKPNSDQKELEEYIRKIHPVFISRIIIHSHYSLIKKYNLKGIHFPEKVRREAEVKEIIQAARTKRLLISSSVHTLEEIPSCNQFDYVFLSPVYPSISKPGHVGNLTPAMFKEWKQNHSFKIKIIALGGIGSDNCEELLEAGFDGIALLGTIWEKSDKEIKIIIKNYSDIKAKVDY